MEPIRLAVCLLCLAFALPACSDTDDPQESDEEATGGQAGGSSTGGQSDGTETGGESGHGGSGGTPEDFESCEELSEEECAMTEGFCIPVTARKLGIDDAGDPCRSEETVTECRTFGHDCDDGDAEAYWCDENDDKWLTPQVCGPFGMDSCESPGFSPPYCP